MEKENLYKERMARIGNAVEHKATDRVPIVSAADNWCLGYYNTTLQAALKDPEIEFAAYAKVATDFRSDAGLFAGISYPVNFAASLGNGIYSDQMETLQISTGHSEIMPAEDYDKLIDNPHSYIVNYVIPKKCSYLGSETTIGQKAEGLSRSMGILLKTFQEKNAAMERFKNEYAYPIPNIVPPFMPGDLILDYLRDFKGTMSDIRRCPEKISKAAMALCTKFCIPATAGMAGSPVYDKYLQLFLHLPAYLKPKDFETVYWPSFKLYMETFAQQGYKFIVLFEKNYSHLYDYIKDLPANCILGMFEEDDLSVVKSKLPNLAVYGGIHTNSLKYASVGECVEITKSLIDELAPGGGYVFGPNKLLLSYGDARPECLKAVTDYVYSDSDY